MILKEGKRNVHVGSSSIFYSITLSEFRLVIFHNFQMLHNICKKTVLCFI